MSTELWFGPHTGLPLESHDGSPALFFSTKSVLLLKDHDMQLQAGTELYLVQAVAQMGKKKGAVWQMLSSYFASLSDDFLTIKFVDSIIC